MRGGWQTEDNAVVPCDERNLAGLVVGVLMHYTWCVRLDDSEWRGRSNRAGQWQAR